MEKDKSIKLNFDDLHIIRPLLGARVVNNYDEYKKISERAEDCSPMEGLIKMPTFQERQANYLKELYQTIPKEIVFNEQNKRTTLIFNNGVVRTQTHETDTHDNWFGFLIAMAKHYFRRDNTKYRRFIEQLYSYPKKRMEVALEFFVYNILSSYLSNYQFNKLKNRIQKLNTTESVITFKDFDIKVKLKGLLPF